jgi:hypothetical protein
MLALDPQSDGRDSTPIPGARSAQVPYGKRNVRGEPVFSVMAAGWFCEKSG